MCQEAQEVLVHSEVDNTNYDNFSLSKLLAGNPLNKKQKLNVSPIVFVRMKVKDRKQSKVHTLKALLDTGCTSTLVNEKFAKTSQVKTRNATRWKTSSGYFETTAKSKVQFTLPELHEQRIITHEVHVTRNEMGYDMIIGMDLLTQLKIDILNSSQTILWDTAEIPMRPRDATLEDAYFIADPKAVSQATARLTEILDAKYDKADLKQVTEDCPELTNNEKKELLKLLLQYERMFDGTLGKWKGDPYDIHLKDDINPYHGKPIKFLNVMKTN